MKKADELLEGEFARILDMYEVWLRTPMLHNENALANWYDMRREHYEQLIAYYAGYMAGKKEARDEKGD
jgi:hypothetical protein